MGSGVPAGLGRLFDSHAGQRFAGAVGNDRGADRNLGGFNFKIGVPLSHGKTF